MPVKLTFLVTAPITAATFLHRQLAYLGDCGFDVSVICSPGEALERLGEEPQITLVTIPMAREISPLKDLLALWRIYRTLGRTKPVIVNASTPKAGLLGMLAAWLAHTPIRIYQQRGLRLETTQGLRRQILTLTERLAASCATVVVCNSPSLLQTIADLRLAPRHKLRVLGAGSSNGVDVARFCATPARLQAAGQLRQHLGIPPDAQVLGFAGRFTRDKGIVELIELAQALRTEFPTLQLLLVGDYEAGDPVPPATRELIVAASWIHVVGFVADPAPYYHLMDLLVFLSYREGLPNVPLEAAAAGVPTVAFRATGVVDAVLDGETGRLVPIGAIAELVGTTAELLRAPEQRRQLGAQAFARVQRDFEQQQVWANWRQLYLDCLAAAGYSALLVKK